MQVVFFVLLGTMHDRKSISLRYTVASQRDIARVVETLWEIVSRVFILLLTDTGLGVIHYAVKFLIYLPSCKKYSIRIRNSRS